MKQLHEFTTLVEAQEEKVYKQISSNKAEQFFNLTGLIDKVEAGLSNNTKDIELIAGMPTSAGLICKAIVNTLNKSDGHFEINPSHPDGAFNHAAMDALVNKSVFTRAEADAFISLGVSYPYKNVTQEEFDSVKNPYVPVEQEVIYPSETYIITTGTQGIDVTATADKDCTLTVYLSIATKDQHDINSYFRYASPVGQINVKDGKGMLSLSSRKVRTYNKLYVVANNDAEIVATAQTNRG